MGCICHVFQRGNNREFLFRNEESKGMMLHQFYEFKKKFDYELLGFVIMNNHYHIIIKLNNDTLDDIMFAINNIYAKYINKSLSRSGHVFESRYHCKIVDSDNYLLWLLRYIHRNPIRAKIVDNLEAYPWSSHYFYMNAANEKINTSFILNLISKNKAQAIFAYSKYMIVQGNDNDQDDDFKTTADFWKERLESTAQYRDNPIVFIRTSLEDIANDLFKDNGTRELILNGSKQQCLVSIKIAFILKAKDLHYSTKEISDFLNCAQSTITYLSKKNHQI